MAEKSTIARPYAQAVFDLARAAKDFPGWSRMLQFAAMIVVDPVMTKYIDNPHVSKTTMVKFFSDVGKGQISEQGNNFLSVLIENKRLSVLPEIAAIYEQLRAEAEKRIDAEVISAFPLSDAQRTAISNGLKKRLGRDINLVAKVDANLIGGAIVRAGDMVIDGSINSHLEKLAFALSH